jgi:hypothetical protein
MIIYESRPAAYTRPRIFAPGVQPCWQYVRFSSFPPPIPRQKQNATSSAQLRSSPVNLATPQQFAVSATSTPQSLTPIWLGHFPGSWGSGRKTERGGLGRNSRRRKLPCYGGCKKDRTPTSEPGQDGYGHEAKELKLQASVKHSSRDHCPALRATADSWPFHQSHWSF